MCSDLIISLGVVLLVGSWDLNFLGFYMDQNKDAKGLTVRRGSEVSQELIPCDSPQALRHPKP